MAGKGAALQEKDPLGGSGSGTPMCYCPVNDSHPAPDRRRLWRDRGVVT